MIHQIVGTLVGRWYATLFGLIFLVLAVFYLGVKRTAMYSAIAITIGSLAENGSVLIGFPYTSYTFNPELRGTELWIVDVPLIVPMSYTFGAYFAFAAARLIVSGPYWSRGRSPLLEYVLAVVLTTWAIWIVDPVMRLGRYHMVGELFQYNGPGFWFGLPLGSQVGYFCTSAILVGVLTVMTRHEPHEPARPWRHPQLLSSLNYPGPVIFAVGSAIIVSHNEGGHIRANANSLAGAAIIIAIPIVLLVAVHWKSLPRPDGHEQQQPPPESNSALRPSTAGDAVGANAPPGQSSATFD